jgi:hypothetical protein
MGGRSEQFELDFDLDGDGDGLAVLVAGLEFPLPYGFDASTFSSCDRMRWRAV